MASQAAYATAQATVSPTSDGLNQYHNALL